jgi:probable HAF family extracellular repeat protein
MKVRLPGLIVIWSVFVLSAAVGIACSGNQSPRARLSFSPASPVVRGTTVELDSTASYDPDGGAITQCKWDRDGDGTYECSESPTDKKTSYTYNTEGKIVVRVMVKDNEGTWSSPYSKTLDVKLPAPVWTGPADGSSCISEAGVTLVWETIDGADSYEVRLGVNHNTSYLRSVDTNSVTLADEELEPGTTYYWQIIAYDASADLTGIPSEISSFTTEPGPAANPDPCESASDVPVDTVLSWKAGAGAAATDGHDVYLGTDFNDVSNATHSSGEYKGAQDSNSYDPCDLSNDTTYFWRIDTIDANGCVAKGPVWRFSTEAGCYSPGQSSNPQPNGTAGEPIDVLLRWQAGDLAQLQEVYLGEDPCNLQFRGAADTNSFDTRRIRSFFFDGSGISDINSLGRAPENPNSVETRSQAFGINEAGVVIGMSYDCNGFAHAYVRTAGELNPVDLHRLCNLGGRQSAAYGINEQNAIVGKVDSNAMCLLYEPNGTNVIMLPAAISEGDPNSVARAISNAGGELGTVAVGTSRGKAAYWQGIDTNEPRVQVLGGVYTQIRSDGYSVNEYGQIAGSRATASGEAKRRAFVWDVRSVVTDLGTLEAGNISEAYGINNSGRVVGRATIDSNDTEFRAFVYDGQMRWLSELIESDANEANWVVTCGWSINDSGNIAARGRVADVNGPNCEYERALLLVPACPLAHWRFDERLGAVVTDSSYAGNHGRVFGAARVVGILRGALSFDGQDDRVDYGSQIGIAQFGGQRGTVTIAAWVRPASVDKFNCITRRFGGVDYLSAGGAGSNEGKVTAQVRNTVDDVNVLLVSAGTIQAGQWSHIALVLDGGRGYRIYINGSLDTEVSEPNLGLFEYGGANYVGMGFDSESYFEGLIDEVVIYPYGAGADEIRRLYERSDSD